MNRVMILILAMGSLLYFPGCGSSSRDAPYADTPSARGDALIAEYKSSMELIDEMSNHQYWLERRHSGINPAQELDKVKNDIDRLQRGILQLFNDRKLTKEQVETFKSIGQ